MPHERLLFAAAVTLLIISSGLMIGGAALDYRDGLGAGAALSQFGRILLLGGGAVSIWYFKWSRNKTDAKKNKLPKLTLGAYAFWIVVTAVLFGTAQLQRQGIVYGESDRLWTLILAVLPVVLAALIVTFFLMRHHLRQQQQSKKGRPRE
jgi:hypothetical protein